MNNDSISFDLGCNFDYKLFDFVDNYDKKHSISSFFGKLKNDGIAGGRATSIIPEFSLEQLAGYISECKKRDIVFNYLINPLSMDQKEIDPVEGKKLRDFIHTLYDMGIKAFTINSPSLIKYVKKEFSDVFVTLGLYAYPVTIHHIEYWRNWGVDEITLDHGFNRRFDLLRQLLTQYKDTDLHLRVIANNLCLRECPFRLAHAGFAGHSDPSGVSMDYSLVNCIYRKITHPTAILSSEFIRPEDIHYYRELAEETGNKHFSIKLVDRTRTTEFLEGVVKAYMTESFDGNLLDIVSWPKTDFIASKAGGPPAGMPSEIPAGVKPMGGGMMAPPPNAPKFRWMDKLKPESMMMYGRTMNLPNIYVDNKKLDGFLDHFINHNNCANSLCADNMLEPGQTAPNACKYCSNWAKKVVSWNEEEVSQWKQVCEGVLNNLEKGDIFR